MVHNHYIQILLKGPRLLTLSVQLLSQIDLSP